MTKPAHHDLGANVNVIHIGNLDDIISDAVREEGAEALRMCSPHPDDQRWLTIHAASEVHRPPKTHEEPSSGSGSKKANT